MKNRELIKMLLDFPLDDEVLIEQTNDSGPERPSAITRHYPTREAMEHERKYKELKEIIHDRQHPPYLVIEGDKFR